MLLAGGVELAEAEAQALDGALLFGGRVVGLLEAAALEAAYVVLAVLDEARDEPIVAEYQRTDVLDELLARLGVYVLLVAEQARGQIALALVCLFALWNLEFDCA